MFEIDNRIKFINIYVIHSSVVKLLIAEDGMKFTYLCHVKFEYCVSVSATDNGIISMFVLCHSDMVKTW